MITLSTEGQKAIGKNLYERMQAIDRTKARQIEKIATNICPFCEKNKTEPGFLCDECAKKRGKRADIADHINACDW